MSQWNSLEFAKIAVSSATPIIVLVLGIIINNSIKRGERSVQLRQQIYETIGGKLNDIYCYLSFVGNWKDHSPIDIIAHKREIDRIMYTYRPFFSNELFNTYQEFTDEVFMTYQGVGIDAKIRSTVCSEHGDRRGHSSCVWNSTWDDRFTNEDNIYNQERYYTLFLKQMAHDLKL